MFSTFSEESQLIIIIVAIALLFVAVVWNNGRNKKNLYGRKKRDFKKNVTNKVKNRKK